MKWFFKLFRKGVPQEPVPPPRKVPTPAPQPPVVARKRTLPVVPQQKRVDHTRSWAASSPAPAPVVINNYNNDFATGLMIGHIFTDRSRPPEPPPFHSGGGGDFGGGGASGSWEAPSPPPYEPPAPSPSYESNSNSSYSDSSGSNSE